MRKIGYMLYHQDSDEIIEECNYLTSNGCLAVFKDHYNNVKENPNKNYPQFELMLTLSNPNDVIVVRDLSYIASSFKHLVEVLNRLISRNLELLSLEGNINTLNQDFHKVFAGVQLFSDLYRYQVGTKARETKAKNEVTNDHKKKSGMRRRTLKKARKVWNLKKEGRLKNNEIMDLMNINQGSFYQYCKLGKDGFLD